MNSSETFCLRWNDFEDNILGAWRGLRQEQEYCDVTLACDDGLSIEAHRIILSAGSQVLSDIFKRSKHPNPFIYLKGIKQTNLENVLDFLYNGEVNIPQEDLNKFLETAQELQVKGLLRKPENIVDEKQVFENQYKESYQQNIELEQGDGAPSFDQEHPTGVFDSTNNSDLDITEDDATEVRTNDELDDQIEQRIGRKGVMWECKTCGKLAN